MRTIESDGPLRVIELADFAEDFGKVPRQPQMLGKRQTLRIDSL